MDSDSTSGIDLLKEIESIREYIYTLQLDQLDSVIENYPQNGTSYDHIFDQIPIGIVTVNSNAIIINSNQAISETLDLDPNQINGFDLRDSFTLLCETPFIPHFNKLISKNNRFDIETPLLVTTAGKPIYLRCRGVAFEAEKVDQSVFVLMFVDITRHKMAQEALRKSEAKYQDLLESIDEIIFAADVDGIITYLSNGVETVLGFKPKELISEPLTKLFHEDDVRPMLKALNRHMQGESGKNEFRMLTKRGETRWIRLSAQPTYDNGRVRGIHGYLVDFTEQHLKEIQLRNSERRYNSLYEASNDAILLVENDLIVDCNPKTLELFDRPREEIINHSLVEFCPEQQSDGKRSELFLKPRIQECYEGQPQYFEWIYLGKAKKKHYSKVSLNRLDFSGQYYILVFIHDITEQKNLERQLREAQKMENIGRLASGLAHDFNNILTIVQGYSELILNIVEDDNPLQKYVRNIHVASVRAESLTKRMLRIARNQAVQARNININDLIVDLDELLERLIGEDINLKLDLNPELGSIKADPHQIEQVILNLVINARDAMPRGGKLTIRSDNISIRENQPGNLPIAGDYIFLSISDTGEGMDEETKSRIFEPFFTTKKGDKGTGLGLATVHSIISQNNGYIEAESIIDCGSTFKIFIPLVSGKQAEENRAKPSTIEEPDKETILVVEDEFEVRNLISEILKMNGYQVFLASNGEEALKLCELREQPLDLVITDMVMPKLNGLELIERLKQIHPTVKVILISGYTEEAMAQKNIHLSDICFLQKPFTPMKLVSEVKEIFESVKAGEPL